MNDQGVSYMTRHNVANALGSKTIPKKKKYQHLLIRATKFETNLPALFSTKVLADRITEFEDFDFQDAEGKKTRARELDAAVARMFEKHGDCCGWNRKGFKKGGPGLSDLLLKINGGLKTDYVSGRDCVELEEIAMMIAFNEAIAAMHPTAWTMMNLFGTIREGIMSKYYEFLIEASSTDPEKKAAHEKNWKGEPVSINDAIDFVMVDAHESMGDCEPEEEDGPCSYFDRGDDEGGDYEGRSDEEEATLEHVSKKIKVDEED